MKKTLLVSLSLMVLLAFTTTSCQKDSTTATSFTATLEPCQEQDGKTVFSNGFMHWVSGDQIKVFGTAGSGIYQAASHGGSTTFNLVSGDAGSAPYRAIYPATAAINNGTIELPVVQVTTDGSLTGFPMFSKSNGTTLAFNNLCGVLRLRLQKTGVSITGIEITTDAEVAGRFRINSNGTVPSLTLEEPGEKSVMLTCSTPQSISNSKDFYIFLPENVYHSMKICIYSSNGKVCTKTLNANQSINIQRSMITTITMSSSLSFTQNAGTLSGLFTVANGQQVRFSQGNLQYINLGTHAGDEGSNMPGTWHFATQQYYIDNDWGIFWKTIFAWASANEPYNYETTGRTFVDWGENAISNGGNQCSLWRTLSTDEWDYLFNTRTDASSKYGAGNINGVAGLIILPDSWVEPYENSFTPGFLPEEKNNDTWSLNSYTLSQWSEMETAGAVFLPADGFREHGKISRFGIGTDGLYWSSTPYDDDKAYFMSFHYRQGVSLSNIATRRWERSVRLVQNN